MKNLLFFLLLSCTCAINAQQLPLTNKRFVMQKGLTEKDYIPGVVIVKFKPVAFAKSGVTKSATGRISAPDLAVKSALVLSVTQKFPSAPAAASTLAETADTIGLNRIFELRFSGGVAIETLINEILQDDRVQYAEPYYIFRSNFTPNDTRYLAGQQAYLNQVKAPQAWDITRNASGIIIAIVDTGTDFAHQDLAANIYLNSADPVNGIDDDHDGYIDNYRGWDFVGNSASTLTEDNDPSVKSAPADHGIHVSGIASAVSNNNLGVASIAMNAKLMIVKAGADDNGNAIYRGYDGIKYAADHNAQIINCSWGAQANASFGLDIVNYAISKGCLIVAAAGNDNTNVPDFPAGYPGVFAVANVNINDTRNGTSNYGSYVSISAPGSAILSTTINDTYDYKSGTSMSSPVVASAAALVKSYFPALTMQQVAEKLRSTADGIDGLNPQFAGQLGKGRLNVYRAITESLPSIRQQKITIADNGNSSLPPGATIKLSFDLKNFLSPVNGLNVVLSSADPNVTVSATPKTVTSIGTLATSPMVGPFDVYIKPGTPDNTTIQFKLAYSDNGAYQDFELFNLTVSVDYLNVEVNKIATTFTSNGRVGFSNAGGEGGLGFTYLNKHILFEASLMVGTSEVQVSNNTRNGTSTSIGADEHFVKRVRAARTSTSNPEFEGKSEFDDSGSPNPLNIHIKHRQIAYKDAPDDKYTIVEYDIYNTGNTTLKGVYVGLFTDWDIDDADKNITRYDALNRIGYVQNKSGVAPFGAVKLLSNNAAPAYYPLTYSLASDPMANGDFSKAEKFQTISSGIKSSGLGENSANGYDVMFVSGYGPYNIPALGSVRVAFAFIGGDNLADVQASAAAAQTRYSAIAPGDMLLPSTLELKQNAPNPFTPGIPTTIQYSIPESGEVNLAVYDLIGRKVKTLVNAFVGAGVHAVSIDPYDMETGIYIYRIQYKNEEKALKMSVIR